MCCGMKGSVNGRVKATSGLNAVPVHWSSFVPCSAPAICHQGMCSKVPCVGSKQSLTTLLEKFKVFFLEKSGHGEGEKSCDGGLVLCDSCAAAPLPLRMVQEAFGNCGAAGAITALSHSYLEGENRAQWGYLNNMGWVNKSGWACSFISDTFSLSVLLKSYSCVPAWPVPALLPANLSKSLASCLLLLSFPKIICERSVHPKILLACLCALL